MTDQVDAHLIARDMAATLATPVENFASRSASVMSKISGSNTLPLSYTLKKTIMMQVFQI